MSSIIIQDLAHSTAMDSQAMSAVRGGIASGPNINVNVSLDQRIGSFQQIGVSVLNNNRVIGARFAGPDMEIAAAQWSSRHAIGAAI
jgi:hypothetical protein